MVRSDAGLRFARLSGVEMAYVEQGAGPAVVFLHGASLDHRLWDPELEEFAGELRCIAPDLRNHGATRWLEPGEIITVADHAADVAGLLNVLEIRAAHVVGLSLGGMVAYQLALDHPEKVLSLATLGAPASIRAGALINLLLRAHAAWTYRGLSARDREPYARRATWAARSTAGKEYLRRNARGIDLPRFRPVWEGVLTYRLAERLPGLRVPALVMSGAKDRNLRQCRAAAKLIPGARLEVIGGAGHLLNLDAPAEVHGLLRRWFAEHSRR
jgi:3-oxoadipate enol-lactonase